MILADTPACRTCNRRQRSGRSKLRHHRRVFANRYDDGGEGVIVDAPGHRPRGRTPTQRFVALRPSQPLGPILRYNHLTASSNLSFNLSFGWCETHVGTSLALSPGTRSEPAPEIGGPTKHLIVIVDDDGPVRSALRSLLKPMGFPAETFPSVDVNMPGMTGPALHRHLRAWPIQLVPDAASALPAAEHVQEPRAARHRHILLFGSRLPSLIDGRWEQVPDHAWDAATNRYPGAGDSRDRRRSRGCSDLGPCTDQLASR